MKIKVTIRPRLRKNAKVEISSETGKLFAVVDDQVARPVNPPPDEKKFHVGLVADQLVTNGDLFKCDYVKLEKLPMYIAPDFLKALNEIAVKAGQKGVEFTPYKKMLRALYRDAERVALYLQRTDPSTDVESLMQYKTLFKLDDDKQAARILKPGVRICAELLGVKDFYKKFNDIAAQHYGKVEHSVLRKHIEGYASGFHEPSNWVCAVALEVLSQSKTNVFDLGIDPDVVRQVWLKSNLNRKEKPADILVSPH
jgi:hypothetical protein